MTRTKNEKSVERGLSGSSGKENSELTLWRDAGAATIIGAFLAQQGWFQFAAE
jgi:hypothetical protein